MTERRYNTNINGRGIVDGDGIGIENECSEGGSVVDVIEEIGFLDDVKVVRKYDDQPHPNSPVLARNLVYQQMKFSALSHFRRAEFVASIFCIILLQSNSPSLNESAVAFSDAPALNFGSRFLSTAACQRLSGCL